MSKNTVIIISVFLALISFTIIGSVNSCDPHNILNNNLTEYKPRNDVIDNCDCLTTNRCIRKCCLPGFYLQKGSICSSVYENSENLTISVYRDKDIYDGTFNFNANFLVGILKCEFYKLSPDYLSDVFFIQRNGKLWMNYTNRFFENEKYCVDGSQYNNETRAYLCFEEDPVRIQSKINVTGMIISMPFLLATFLVYLVLPERNLHMKALMFYVISLLLGYILLVYIQLSDLQLPDEVCTMLGLLVVFFFILSFLWMNVICIDIWLTFRGIKGISGSKRNAERKRLIIYCAYTWGLTLLHVLVVFIINKYAPKDSWYNPGVGFGQCFLRDGYPQLLYFYGPMGVVIICNVTLFAMTAFKIRQVKNDTKVLRSSENSSRHSKENEQKYYLYLKLLLAMGINWIMELISWVVEWKLREAPKYIWYLTDFCNAIYGVFIFFLFVFKRKIWTMLKKRYYTFMGRPHMAHGMSSQRTTQTSTYESQSTDPNLTDKSLRMESLRK